MTQRAGSNTEWKESFSKEIFVLCSTRNCGIMYRSLTCIIVILKAFIDCVTTKCFFLKQHRRLT